MRCSNQTTLAHVCSQSLGAIPQSSKGHQKNSKVNMDGFLLQLNCLMRHVTGTKSKQLVQGKFVMHPVLANSHSI